jgi:L-alanine-DL-glutamate epimerase-like enolase superfamily enzyme
MKITQIETIHLKEHATLLFVRVHTDEGLIGHGETKYAIDALHGFIHQYAAPLLLGKNPLQIDRHWRTIYEAASRCGAKGVEMRALSALDCALWDILGQAAGMPIYQLLGGASHDRMPVYNTCAGPVYARSLNRAEGIGAAGKYEDLEAFTHRADELASELVAEGFKGMKIWPFDPFAAESRGQRISLGDLDTGLEPFRKIRQAVGNQIEIMVEGHGLWSLPAARRIAAAVEEFEPYWIEDLIRPESVAALVELRNSTSTPMLVSEMLMTRYEYGPMLEAGAADIVMIDPVWCGGISEARKIGHMAETRGLPVTFHDCAGPFNLFTGLHLAFNAPNTLFQEMVRAFVRTFYDDLATVNVEFRDGYLLPPVGPGLGTALRPEVLTRGDATVQVSKAGYVR